MQAHTHALIIGAAAILAAAAVQAAPNIPPEFTEDSYAFEVTDGAAVDTLVGTISATDSDGPNTVEYTITDGNDGNPFALDAGTGELTVAGTIDLNTQATYTLTVEASDGADSTVGTVLVDVVAPPVTVAFVTSVLGETQWVSKGYGDIGYLFANTDDNDPAAGDFKRGGVLYTDSETPVAGQAVMFTPLSSKNWAWNRRSGNAGNELTATLNAVLENPDGGTFHSGALLTGGLGTNDFRDSFRLDFDEDVPDGYRVGILVGAMETQGEPATIDGSTGNLRDVPYQLQVGSVSVATTQRALDPSPAPDWLTLAPDDANTGAPRADWYFFDLTNIKAGASVTISAARVYSDFSHKFNPVNGVVILPFGAAVSDPVITGTSLSGNIFTIDFTGEPGVTDWKIMAGTDLQSFPDDKTPASIPESAAGVYRAQVDVMGAPANYFMRIER